MLILFFFSLCLIKSTSVSLCKRYKTPECDEDARSYVADTEDPFHIRPLQGSLPLSYNAYSLWAQCWGNFTSQSFRPNLESNRLSKKKKVLIKGTFPKVFNPFEHFQTFEIRFDFTKTFLSTLVGFSVYFHHIWRFCKLCPPEAVKLD